MSSLNFCFKYQYYDVLMMKKIKGWLNEKGQ